MFPEGRISEFLVVAVVALIVVGPKDLPVLLRKLGQFMAKLRGMAAEFRASFDEMARQSELDELRKEVEAMRRGQFSDVAAQAGKVEITQTFDDIHQSLSDVGAQLHPPMSYQYTEPTVEAPKPRARRTPAKAAASKGKAAPKVTAKAKAAPKTAARKAAPAKHAPANPRKPTVEGGS